MSELRWNPLLGTWTIVAPNRQDRPTVTDRGCPFCPGSGKVPSQYTVLSYDNDFPALSLEVPEEGGLEPQVEAGPYRSVPGYGKCEVILYSSDHEKALWELSPAHLESLVDLWCERCAELSKDPRIKYVFVFENRGPEVGVTIHHPHGQIYAYSFVPLKLQTELENCKRYFDGQGICLLCHMNQTEEQSGMRMIAQNQDFLAYLPYFTDYPYGVFIVPRRHIRDLPSLTRGERANLAQILKEISGAFDTLFDRVFPYMMCVHQVPVNSPEFDGAENYYHLHIEFYPPLRAKNRIKYYASSEMGAWAACNPLFVEETALKLREALEKFRSQHPDGVGPGDESLEAGSGLGGDGGATKP
ncbi:MAG TPA: galactose-1-phosphate uridylyltransferase [Firmicutes bacterium]|nr:galactose-1-phosphate uridylyltransferase [Candidatus Fermentithermobacillaceae bacterium]